MCLSLFIHLFMSPVIQFVFHLGSQVLFICLSHLKINCPLRSCLQMTSAFFGISYTPWWLCQPVVIFWPTSLCFKHQIDDVICGRIWIWFEFLESSLFPSVLISIAYNIGHCFYNQPSICPKSVPVEPSETFYRWIPLNPWSFHYSSYSVIFLRRPWVRA